MKNIIIIFILLLTLLVFVGCNTGTKLTVINNMDINIYEVIVNNICFKNIPPGLTLTHIINPGEYNAYIKFTENGQYYKLNNVLNIHSGDNKLEINGSIQLVNVD